jgi:hypothetical protein
MQIYQSQDPARAVYAAEPMNRHHPLNRGRLAWYLAIPATSGGRQWFDIAGPNHGTLTNMGTGTNGWRPTTRPGGHGHLLFDGNVAGPQVRAPAVVGPAGGFSAALWLAVPAVASVVLLVSQYQPAASYLQFFLANDVVQFRIIGTDVGSGLPYIGRATGPVATANSWMRLVGTWDGTTTNAGIKVYFNGVQADTTNDGAGTFVGPSTSAILPLISCQNAVDAPLTGAVDDVSRWDRPLSPAEVRADHELGRRGYPGVLNRY